MTITLKVRGNFDNTEKFLKKISSRKYLDVLERYGNRGVAALASATPSRSGKTAASWSYEVERKHGSAAIIFKNSNINKGVPIAIILQYGHGTGTGGYVQGRDYINPAIQPIFDQLAEEAWKEIMNA